MHCDKKHVTTWKSFLVCFDDEISTWSLPNASTCRYILSNMAMLLMHHIGKILPIFRIFAFKSCYTVVLHWVCRNQICYVWLMQIPCPVPYDKQPSDECILRNYPNKPLNDLILYSSSSQWSDCFINVCDESCICNVTCHLHNYSLLSCLCHTFHCLFIICSLLITNCSFIWNFCNYTICLCGLYTEGKNALQCLLNVVWLIQKYCYWQWKTSINPKKPYWLSFTWNTFKIGSCTTSVLVNQVYCTPQGVPDVCSSRTVTFPHIQRSLH